jgi:tyrosyl-tRNA synthetase
MGQWFGLAAYRPATAVAEILEELRSGRRHPGDTKRELARSIVTRYWGEAAADDAEAAFDLLFKQHSIPDDVPEHRVGSEDPVWLPGLLNAAGLVSSNGEGRRMLKQLAVRIDGDQVAEETVARATLVGAVVQVGKRRFVRVVG